MKKILILVLMLSAVIIFAAPRELVIVEKNMSLSCPFCPGASLAAEELVSNGHNVAVIEYHLNDAYATAAANNRMGNPMTGAYYNNNGMPTTYFDGVNSGLGGNLTQSMYAQFLPFYETAIAVESPVFFDINGSIENDQINITITINRDTNVTMSDLLPYFHFVITESGVPQEWGNGVLQFTELNFVQKFMQNTGAGIPLDFTESNMQTVEISRPVNLNWNLDEIEFIFFVQSMSATVPTSNSPIYQGAKRDRYFTNPNPTTVQRKPVLEVFSSSTCPPCAHANPLIENVLSQYQGQYSIIKYQLNFPGAGDPYYIDECGVRRQYYNVSSVPSLRVNGSAQVINQFNTDVFATLLEQTTNIELSANAEISGNTVTANVTITPLSSHPAGLKLHLAIVEKTTVNNAASNGETDFHNVLMRMTPDANGTALEALSAGTPVTFDFTQNVANTNIEQLNDLRLIVFVQNDSNKEILQSETVDVSGDFNDYTVTFNISDSNDNLVEDAVLFLQDYGTNYSNSQGIATYNNILAGTYSYNIIKTGLFPTSGTLTVTNANLNIDIVLEAPSAFFFEDFNSGIPETWTIVSTSPDMLYHTGGRVCFFSQSMVLNNMFLISPQIDFNGAETLTFEMQDAMDPSNSGQMQIGYLNNTQDLASFVVLGSYPLTVPLQEYSVDLSELTNTGHLAWKFNSNSFAYVYMDNVSISASEVTPTETQKKPVIELFSSSTCPPCATANPMIDNVLSQFAGQYSLIKYQVNWPGAGDPYYIDECGVRRNYYNVSAVPSLYINGVQQTISQFNATLMQNLTAQMTNVNIEILSEISGNTVTSNITLTPLETLPAGLKLHVAIVEKTTFNNATTNGETEFHNVLMKMTPDANGTTLEALTAGTPVNFEFTQNVSNTNIEQLNDLRLIAFIQNNSNKQILQSETADITGDFDEYNVTFTVRDNENNLLDGASIFLENYGTNLSNPDGVFVFNNILPGDYSYNVSKTGYYPATGNFTVTNNDLSIDVELVLPQEDLLPVRNLTASVSGANVTLNWNEPGLDGQWITHSLSDETGNGVGTNSATSFMVAQRFTQEQLNELGVTGSTLSKISFVPNFQAAEYAVKVWTGGSGSPLNPGSVAATQVVPNFIIENWNIVSLNQPVTIPSDGELWIGFTINTTGGFPAGCDAGPQFENYGNLMFFNGQWTTLTTLAPTLTYNWQVKAYIEESTVVVLNNNVSETNIVNENIYTQELLTVNWDVQKNTSTKFNSLVNRDLIGYKVFRGETLLTNSPITALTFTDTNLENGNYTYSVIAVYDEGDSAPVNVNVTVDTSSDTDILNGLLITKLTGNYPNPFNPETLIKFRLAKDEHVNIEVFNTKGQKIITLKDEFLQAGQHQILWQGLDESGRKVSSGIYFYRMQTQNYRATNKMLLIK